MKTNLQFFAEDRTNMVSLLDIGTLIGSTAKIVEMGDGYRVNPVRQHEKRK